MNERLSWAEDETDEPLHTQPLDAEALGWWQVQPGWSNPSCGSTCNRLDRLGSAEQDNWVEGDLWGDAWFLLGLDAGGWEKQAPIDNSSIKRQLDD